MKLMLPDKTEWEVKPSLLDSFGLDYFSGPIMSIVGGGGKTSTLMQLAKEYEYKDRQVIVTTTTHMMPPRQWTWCREESIDIVDKHLSREKVLWIGRQSETGKMKSPSRKFLVALTKKKIPMLIEADGAKRLPFKVPREWEPVILDETTMVIAVLGMDALGKPLKKMCFNYEQALDLLKKSEDNLITKEDYVKVLSHNWGLKKDVKPHMDYVVVLNKVDNNKRLKDAITIRRMLKEQGTDKVFLTSYLH